MGEFAQLSEKEFERWMQPHAVLGLMGDKFDGTKTAIATRIQNGSMRTAAGEIRWPGDNVEFRPLQLKFWDDWAFLNEHDFWRLGDRTVFLNDIRFDLHDVRLHPHDVEKLLHQTGRGPRAAGTLNQATQTSAPAPAGPPISATRGDPPISEAVLKAWWSMCQLIKKPDAWTHEEIRTFYDRCFPDRFLSRDRQRALRDGVKSGKKA